jgi:hypothetical protein
MGFRLAAVAIMGATLGAPLGNCAQARSASDGYWTVAVTGQSGSCQGGSYRYAVQIVNGIIRYPGADARITGRVSPKGAVYVSVSTSDRSAVGSGRLSRNFGSGSFHGQSSSGWCGGTWFAQRTGG